MSTQGLPGKGPPGRVAGGFPAEADNIVYQPADPAAWPTVPNNVAEALDEIGGGNRSYGNFVVITPIVAIPIAPGGAIPFGAATGGTPAMLPTSSDVSLVIDTTFNLGAMAVALATAGIYEVTYGIATAVDSWYSLTLNGQLYTGGNIAINGDLDGTLASITVLVQVTPADLAAGQGGLALIEIIVPSTAPATSIGSAGPGATAATVAAYISLTRIA
jgi:hypothetical protein